MDLLSRDEWHRTDRTVGQWCRTGTVSRYLPRATGPTGKNRNRNHHLPIHPPGIARPWRHLASGTHHLPRPIPILGTDVIGTRYSHDRRSRLGIHYLDHGKSDKRIKTGRTSHRQKRLPNLTSGFNAVRLAQLSLSRWEFKQAAAYYKQAARHFETLARQSAKNGLSESPMRDYVHTFQTAAQEIRKNGSRWVCRDHLTAIARLLTAYRRDHRGEMPDQLSELQKWTVAESRANPETIARLFRAPIDRDNTRPISYFYRPDAATGEAIVISYFYPGRLVELIRHTENYRLQDRLIGQTQIDSLVEMGKTLLSQNDSLAVPILTALTHVAPELELGHCLLGYAYLEVAITTVREVLLNAPLTSTTDYPRRTTDWDSSSKIAPKACTMPSAISEKLSSGLQMNGYRNCTTRTAMPVSTWRRRDTNSKNTTPNATSITSSHWTRPTRRPTNCWANGGRSRKKTTNRRPWPMPAT